MRNEPRRLAKGRPRPAFCVIDEFKSAHHTVRAGSNPQTKPVAMETPRVKSRTLPLTAMSLTFEKVRKIGASRMMARTPQIDSRTPPTAPRTAKRRLSVNRGRGHSIELGVQPAATSLGFRRDAM